MTVSRIDLHPLGGIAGDMFAAAVFDAYPDLYEQFQDDLSRLSISGLSATLEPKLAKGLGAKHFSVVQTTDEHPPRTLKGVIKFLADKNLDQTVVDAAIGIYTLLAKAEAAVHGKTIDTIHFHEVSDWDSMVDIIAAAGAIARLNCHLWRLAPLPLGGGTITTAHGDIPLPAPATVQLLKDYEWIDDGQPGERVTPTGAAIIAYLSPVSMQGAVAARLSAIGVGCGTRELADRANILRLSVFHEAANEHIIHDVVCSLSFDIDDMTAEELANALDHLRQAKGVLDCSSMAMQGKKGRHMVGVRLLVLPQFRDQLIDQCFTQCSTLGIRHEQINRATLRRETQTVDGVRVKVTRRSSTQMTAKPESDDLSEAGSLHERRQLSTRIENTALAAFVKDGHHSDE